MSIKDLNKEDIILGGVALGVIILLIILLTNLDSLSFRQVNDFINNGNDKYEDQQYDEAKIKYAGALNLDSLNSGAHYNNANADYRNGRYDMANSSYEKAIRTSLRSNASDKEKELVSSMYHNKGNANMKTLTPLDSILEINEMIKQSEAAGNDVSQAKQQFYQNLQQNLSKVQTPIKDYKDGLRNAPNNDSTRFNLAMAQDYQKRVAEILQNMVPPSSSNNNQNQDKKDDQQQQDQQQQQQQQQQQEEQEQEQDPNQMSKDNAEQILKALEQEEKDQLKKKKVEKDNSRYKTDKDW